MKLQSNQLIDKMQKLAKKKAQLDYKERQLREKSRKQTTKKFIEVGSIASKFGITDFDTDTLHGAFAEIQERAKLDEVKNQWKKTGSDLLGVSQSPLLISFEKQPTEEIITTLKSKRFIWNKFRKEWQGYGMKEEMESLVKDFNGKVELANN